ncbi:hypothetical protein GCM10009416_21350 [Craurococcus roseus]|uniref:Uncharacterized protein n=1 Tax=Craurococcus roseus TaxID=77585 RepID=A0ABN1F562_9PROT
MNLGEPPWSNPETRVPFVDEGNERRRGRSARRSRDRDAQAAQNRRQPREERDRAYMGGGMVGDTRTGAATAPSTGTGADIRPMPMGTTNQTR